MNTRALQTYKSSLKLSDRQGQILVGTLLGDGHLEKQRGARVPRLKIEHGLGQSAYVVWKFKELREWVRTPPRVRERRNRLGTSSTNIGFTTLSHPSFEEFWTSFYADGRKVVPETLKLTPLSMAVWFMDDGSRKSSECRGLYLNTQSFTAEEVEFLRAVMHRDVCVETSVRRQRDGLQIYLPASSAGKMRSLIVGDVLPSMRYKLSG